MTKSACSEEVMSVASSPSITTADNLCTECSGSTFGLLENADDIGRRRVSSSSKNKTHLLRPRFH